MKRELSAIALLGCLLALAATPVFGNVWLADYRGYDYTWPLPNDFITDGQFYSALGPVVSMNGDFFILDEVTFEYTVHIHSGTLTAAESVGDYDFYYYQEGDGTISFYEDSRATGTQFDYGTFPPNDTAPSTFIDGTLMLRGSFVSLRIAIDRVDGGGSFSGTVDFNQGEYLENIPPDMRDGWTFAGLGQGNDPLTPNGYMNQVDGEVYLEEGTPTQESSWGRIKRLYDR